ncbi:PIR protein [Plasmodium vivax]|uniref:VIR protein n=1 Tax=Plasmodium vivax TaxID=5855 RepID=A0A565A453_PLAVI|nr:PIR protein [Plasmodium vivax]
MTCIINCLFFNYIDKYIENTEKIEKDHTAADNNEFCDKSLSDDTLRRIENVVTICKQFVALYNKHISLKNNLITMPSYNSDCEYMNYWLNTKLNNNNNSITVNKFYAKLKTISGDFDKKGSLNGKIYDIDKGELEHLNVLYNLRQKYSKIYTWVTSRERENKPNCTKNADDLFNDYMFAINDCSSNESTFCKLLCNLREEYNIAFKTYDKNNECNAKKTKLQTYDEIYPSVISSSIKIDRNTMSIPLLGPIIALVFILTFFYRFTAIGPWLRNKVRTTFYRGSYKNTNRNELLLQNFDKQNINSSPGIYNITYNSARNN